VTDLLDVDAPGEWAGTSLAPSVLDRAAPADDPVVSVTVRGDDVTSQPIPGHSTTATLLVSVRDRDWTYVENVDTETTELYYRPDDPTQQTDLSTDPTEEAEAVVERFAPLVDAHAALLRDRAERSTTDEVGDDLGARLEALGYR